MKKFLKICVTIVLVLSLSLICGNTMANSLWNDNGKPLWGDAPRTFKIGDLITIIISEAASASQNAVSSNSKTGSLSTEAGTGLLEGVLPELGGGWESAFKGNGATTRGGSLNAKLTVTVSSVTPEGTLLVEGTQAIKVNKDNQLLTIRGKIRPENVSVSNTVYSMYVADAVIEFQGKGTIGEAQRPGLLVRIFQWIF